MNSPKPQQTTTNHNKPQQTTTNHNKRVILTYIEGRLTTTYKSDELLEDNTTLTDIANEENGVDPQPIPDYIPRKLPNEAINEIVNRFQIPKTVTPTSSIKTNRDIPLDGVEDPVEISSLPIQDDVKDSEERNIVSDAYRKAEESLTTGDKYTLHPITSNNVIQIVIRRKRWRLINRPQTIGVGEQFQGLI